MHINSTLLFTSAHYSGPKCKVVKLPQGRRSINRIFERITDSYFRADKNADEIVDMRVFSISSV